MSSVYKRDREHAKKQGKEKGPTEKEEKKREGKTERKKKKKESVYSSREFCQIKVTSFCNAR